MPGNYASARHIHFVVTHDDFSTAYTEAFFKGDEALGEYAPDDAVILEEATIEDETVQLGTFNIVLSPL